MTRHINRYHICWNVVDLCLSLSIVFILCRLHVFTSGFLSNRNDNHKSWSTAFTSSRSETWAPGVGSQSCEDTTFSGGVTEEVENLRVGRGGRGICKPMCFQKGLPWQVRMFYDISIFDLDVYFCILHAILVISGSKFSLFWGPKCLGFITPTSWYVCVVMIQAFRLVHCVWTSEISGISDLVRRQKHSKDEKSGGASLYVQLVFIIIFYVASPDMFHSWPEFPCLCLKWLDLLC